MDKINIKPLGDRVVVQPAKAEEKTSSGIILPNSSQEKPNNGVVVAVSDSTDDNKLTVKVGDSIIYGSYAGTEIEVDGANYLIMSETDILAVI